MTWLDCKQWMNWQVSLPQGLYDQVGHRLIIWNSGYGSLTPKAHPHFVCVKCGRNLWDYTMQTHTVCFNCNPKEHHKVWLKYLVTTDWIADGKTWR